MVAGSIAKQFVLAIMIGIDLDNNQKWQRLLNEVFGCDTNRWHSKTIVRGSTKNQSQKATCELRSFRSPRS